MKSLWRLFSAGAVLLFASQNVSGVESYLIADLKTGHIFEQEDGREKRQIGSLTKVATAAVVLDWAERASGNLGELVTLPPEAFVNTGENRVGFQPGDVISVRDLLYAALVQSDNIAAATLAQHIGFALQRITPSQSGGGPVQSFVAQMNALARNLKMERTRFVNPHGIDAEVRPRPFSTSLDQARLTRYALNKASFRFYVSQKERDISFRRGERELRYRLRNTNELLGTNGIDGVKTGRTMRAGDCLILSAQREPIVQREGESARIYPRQIVVVMLGSTNRFADGAELVNRGWALYEQWVAAGRMSSPENQL